MLFEPMICVSFTFCIRDSRARIVLDITILLQWKTELLFFDAGVLLLFLLLLLLSSRIQWLDTGFGLVIGFTGLLQFVTTINYNAIAISHSLHSSMARTKSSISSHARPGNGSQHCPLLPLLNVSGPRWLAALSHLTQDSNSSPFSPDSSKSKSHYDRRSVGQSVLVSSRIWGPRPDLCYCQIFAVLSMGAPSLTTGRVCRLSQT
jgi:hypothetical protein